MLLHHTLFLKERLSVLLVVGQIFLELGRTIKVHRHLHRLVLFLKLLVSKNLADGIVFILLLFSFVIP
jgi:hypothetical protein